jgi:hypothetical protein
MSLKVVTNRTLGSKSPYQMFVDAIKSPATKTVYINSLKQHMNHLRLTKADESLIHIEPRLINAQLIDYIISLRQDGLSYYSIKYLVALFLRSTLEMTSFSIGRRCLTILENTSV